MITGAVRIVLFVVSLIAAASSSPPLCISPPFSKMMTCAQRHIEQMSSNKDLLQQTGAPTKSQYIGFMQDYCTSAVPAGLACFQDKISGCDAQLQASVNQAAESGMGFLCQPSGGGLNPAIAAVLGGISDEEFADVLTNGFGPDCQFNDTRQRTCVDKVQTLSRLNTFSSLDEYLPGMQRTATQYFDCMIQLYRELKSTCSSWRTVLLLNVEFLLFMPMLGVSLSYTPEELLGRLEM